LAETLAFVVPWFGPGVSGGALTQCRDTARALAARGTRVEILTTCARDQASPWMDHHLEGPDEVDGLTVRRFKVRPRDPERYGVYDWRLGAGGRLSPGEERTLVAHSINSHDLYAYLAAEQERYWYAFMPCRFGTTWEGVLAAPARSLLIPCLRDEPYAHLGATARALRAVRAVGFHTPAERALAIQVAGGDPGTFALLGGGVEPSAAAGDAERFRRKHRVFDPFLVYVGRKAPDKNTPLLLEYYARYRLTHPDTPLKLVLVGGGGTRIPERLGRDVFDLGFVSVQDKLDACTAALALCQPSVRESFSRVLMEAWLCGTPALVHAACAVTREHCVASGGGLYFGEYFEFVEAVDRLLGDAGLRAALAASGQAHVRATCGWDRVTGNYLTLLRDLGAHL
jgi:glycosyltransferase involved in cell wall biosynthesis